MLDMGLRSHRRSATLSGYRRQMCIPTTRHSRRATHTITAPHAPTTRVRSRTRLPGMPTLSTRAVCMADHLPAIWPDGPHVVHAETGNCDGVAYVSALNSCLTNSSVAPSLTPNYGAYLTCALLPDADSCCNDSNNCNEFGGGSNGGGDGNDDDDNNNDSTGCTWCERPPVLVGLRPGACFNVCTMTPSKSARCCLTGLDRDGVKCTTPHAQHSRREVAQLLRIAILCVRVVCSSRRRVCSLSRWARCPAGTAGTGKGPRLCIQRYMVHAGIRMLRSASRWRCGRS